MTRFYRLSGGGNDFLAVVEPATEPDAAEIRALCSRGLSVGADGLFILERASDAVGMRYFNADGHPADLCLNGTRCAVHLARHLGWGTNRFSIETGAGVIRGWVTGRADVALELPRPAVPRHRTIEHAGNRYSGWFVTVGVPHFVIASSESLRRVPVSELGPPLRRHATWGEAGANVDFVRFVETHRLEIRTFERGVETETLACGTGVMAAVRVGLEIGSLELPVSALTLGGFALVVDHVGPDEAIWTLSGDARLVAEGTIYPGAFELPAPPAWS